MSTNDNPVRKIANYAHIATYMLDVADQNSSSRSVGRVNLGVREVWPGGLRDYS